MSIKYTPTTEQVRGFWASDGKRQPAAKSYNEAESAAEFDRWLAAHDAEVAAKALKSVIDKVDLEAIADEWSDGGEDIGDERAWQVADALEAEVAFREALLSDENVERAAAGMWDRHGREGMFRYAPEHLRAAFKSDARAALRAAIEAALAVATGDTDTPESEEAERG